MKAIQSRLLLSTFVCLLAYDAAATEGGADNYPLGAEGVMAGVLPPPGVYLLGYYQNYHASRFVDKHGKSSVPRFGVNVNAFIPRLVWMTDKQLLGGQLGFYAALPLVDLRVGMLGQRDDRSAMGDTYLASMLGWHSGAHHWAVAVETVLPTGDYDRDHMANVGKNYYTVRPMFGYSYSDPEGWDISTKLSYSFNSRNNDTDYKSGQYFAGDYSVGYRVKPNVTLALEGYAFKQMTSDNVGGEDIGFRGQVFAYGPGIHYQANGWSVEAKYLRETAVENRPQGNTTFVKVVWAF